MPEILTQEIHITAEIAIQGVTHTQGILIQDLQIHMQVTDNHQTATHPHMVHPRVKGTFSYLDFSFEATTCFPLFLTN